MVTPLSYSLRDFFMSSEGKIKQSHTDLFKRYNEMPSFILHACNSTTTDESIFNPSGTNIVN